MTKILFKPKNDQNTPETQKITKVPPKTQKMTKIPRNLKMTKNLKNDQNTSKL